jgi:hypothetical protein
MNIKKIIAVVIVLLIILVSFLFLSEKIFNYTVVEQLNSPLQEDPILPITDIKEEYKDSTYTFVGTIDVPTPCHSLESKVNKISDVIYEIEINTINPSEDIMCAQVITSKQYKVSFEGSENILVYAKINGTIYELSRFVIPEGEDINTFELMIKG